MTESPLKYNLDLMHRSGKIVRLASNLSAGASSKITKEAQLLMHTDRVTELGTIPSVRWKDISLVLESFADSDNP